MLYAYFPHGLPFAEGLQLNCYVEIRLIQPGADYHQPDVGQSLVGANLTLAFPTLNRNLLRLDQVLPTDGANCKDQFWLGP